MLDIVFKTTTGPRKERFNFLHDYSEADLLKVLQVRPNLFMYLKPEQQSDTLIRHVLNWDGYCYCYIKNKSLEYLKLALKNEPKAIKYAGDLLPFVDPSTK